MAIAYKLQNLVTAEELFSMPPSEHFELVRGELKEQMPTGDSHGAKTAWLSAHISIFVYSQNLGDCFAAETGFLLSRDPDTVLAPDFAFVSHARFTSARSGGYVRAIPDLVLETRSPNDRRKSVQDKVDEWLNAGASIVLELNPARQILSVYRPNADPLELGPEDIFNGADILPGFTLALKPLWQTE